MRFLVPNEGTDPWYTAFQTLFGQIDASAYAAREDRNIILMGGGTITWTVSTSTLAWSAPLRVFSPVSGLQCIIAAGSAVLDGDGRLLHAPLVRYPTGAIKTITASVASQVPVATDGDNQLLFALRYNGVIYWRNGVVQGDGVTLTDFEPPASFTAGGDLTGSASSQNVVKVQNRAVDSAAPSVGQVLKWDGAKWTPAADAEGTLPTLVFHPGGTASGNVYTTWASLMAAFGTIPGPILIQFIDDRATCAIPAGTWNLEGRAVLMGAEQSTAVLLEIGDKGGSDAILQQPAGFKRLEVVAVDDAAASNQIDLGIANRCWFEDCTVWSAAKTNPAPMIPVPNKGKLILRGTTLFSTGDTSSIEPVGSADIYLEDFAAIETDALDVGVAATVDVWLANTVAACSPTQIVAGTLTIHTVFVGASASTFVFRPGGSASRNVYTDWVTLMAALALVYGPRIIEFDSSSSGTGRCDIPSGTWNLDGNTVLRGKHAPVVLQDGAVLRNAHVLEGDMDLYSASTGAVFDWSDWPKHLVLKDSVLLHGSTYPTQSAPSSPLIAAGTVTVDVHDSCGLIADAGEENVLEDTTGASVVNLFDSARVGASDSSQGIALWVNGGTIEVKIYNQGVYYHNATDKDLTLKRYSVMRQVEPLTKGVFSNTSVTPMACGAGYLSFKNLVKHANARVYFRAVIETTDSGAGYEANVDLYDIHGQMNAGTPRVVPGSPIDTKGTEPAGAPSPLPTVASLYEVDLTSEIIGGTWDGDIAVFEVRLWITTAGGGKVATCKSAELVLEWVEG